MSYTLSDIRTRVSNNLNLDNITNSDINRWINDTQRRICRSGNFWFMEQEVTRSTVDGQQTYSLPVAGDSNWTEADGNTVLEFKEVIDCYLINSDDYIDHLVKASLKEIRQMARFRDTSDDGVPTHFAIQNNKLYLYYKPDHSDNDDEAWTIVLSFFGYLADLSADTDNNDLTNTYPEVLEAGATALGLRYHFEEERADYWEGKFAAGVQEIIIEEQKRRYAHLEVGMKPKPGACTSPIKQRILSEPFGYD